MQNQGALDIFSQVYKLTKIAIALNCVSFLCFGLEISVSHAIPVWLPPNSPGTHRHKYTDALHCVGQSGLLFVVTATLLRLLDFRECRLKPHIKYTVVVQCVLLLLLLLPMKQNGTIEITAYNELLLGNCLVSA